jgi:hypothetical protein
MLASSSLGFGQLVLSFSTTRTYRQNPIEVAFRPLTGTTNLGNMGVYLGDGSWTETICPLNGSPTWFGPAVPLLPCETGATGYVVTGDLDSDGIRDNFYHAEVTSVIASTVTEPSVPGLVALYSAPPSKLPRPIGDFLDNSHTIYWDTQTEAITEYKLASYIIVNSYDSRTAMDQEVVPGVYEFKFPKLGDPTNPYRIPVNYYSPPEGYMKKNNVARGFRFIRLNGKPLAYTADGYIAMDPRLLNFIEWEGNDADVIFPANDSLFFSIPELPTPPGDPNRDQVVNTLFPGFVAPGTSRLLLPSALQKGFYIPPGFVQLLNPAREGIIQLALERSVPTSGVASDNSRRTYQLPCRFVNTYAGWAATAFPAGTTADKRAANANPDGDLYTNYVEWRNTVPGGYTSNPMVKNTIPPPVLTFVTARATRSTDNVGVGYWETKHAKTQNAYPPIAYQYEFSSDMVNWAVVTDDNPDWRVIETDAEIKAQSKHESPSGTAFLRVKTIQAPEPPPTSLE